MATVAYRCVCGEAINLNTDHGGRRQQCDRHYAPTALQDSVAQTISLAEIGSDSSGATDREVESKDDWVGRKLEHYKIIERLGHGGMGQVYRALDQSLRR